MQSSDLTAIRRIAVIGEAMIELSDLAAEDGRVALGTAGDTVNTAIYLARNLGGETEVSYITALGRDQLSNGMVSDIAAEGIETGHIARHPERLPGIYAIELDDAGERSFRYWRESSAARAMFDPGILSLDLIGGFDMVYLSGITLAILPPDIRRALIGRCSEVKAAGGAVVFDSNYRPRLWPDAGTAREAILSMWAATTLALPSRDDEAALFGEAEPQEVLSRIAGSGVGEIALKDGAGGPHLWAGGLLGGGHYPPAEEVVDTTAAGDSFNAGYLAARIAGKGPVAASEAGHLLAGRVIGYRGAIIPR